MTYRFTVNLPHNQKKVLRISPATPLEQVHQQICAEKRLDPGRHFFLLSSNPSQIVDMQRTVGELGSNEINLASHGKVIDIQVALCSRYLIIKSLKKKIKIIKGICRNFILMRCTCQDKYMYVLHEMHDKSMVHI